MNTRVHPVPSRQETSRELWRRLTGASLGIIALRVSARLLAFITGVLLARFLGARGFGAYENVVAWMALLSVPAGLGAEKLIVRRLPSYESRSQWALARGLLKRVNAAVLVVSVVLVLAALAVASVPKTALASFEGFHVALLMIPVVALLRVQQAALQGFHRVVLGQLPELLLAPLLFAVLLGVAYLAFPAAGSPSLALGLNVAAAASALLAAALFLRRHRPEEVRNAIPAFETRAWIRSAVPLLAIAALQVANNRTDIIMLGALADAESVGQFAAASKGAGLIILVLLAVNGAMAPTLSRLYTKKQTMILQEVVTRNARLAFLAALPLALAFVFQGQRFLAIFGADFAGGETSLTILSISQLVNVGMGSVGLILLMTGHERDVALGLGLGALLNVVLNALLIPVWGQVGAAAATGASTIAWNVALAILVFRRLGIHSTALGSLRR